MRNAHCVHAARRGIVPLLLLALSVGACATRPPESDPEALAAYEQANDPLEPFNRAMWRLNTTFDHLIMRPVTWVYRSILPRPVRRVVSNIYANANMPVVIVNSLLQGEFGRAGTATERFLVNTVLGVGGIADPASAWGIETIDEDFGQTLAVWGIGDGPYLVLPFIGPTNPRDAVGFVGDALSEPVGLSLDIIDKRWVRYGWRIGNVIEARDRHWGEIKEIYRAEDPYAFARSAFRQHRRYLITNGAAEESEEEEKLFDQDFDQSEEPQEAPPVPPLAAAPPAHPRVKRDAIERILLGPGFALHGG